MNEPLVEESGDLKVSREMLKSELERLSSYIAKSARNRVKKVKGGQREAIFCAVMGEISISTACNRTDLVRNLFARLRKIEDLFDAIVHLEQSDYEARFGLETAKS